MHTDHNAGTEKSSKRKCRPTEQRSTQEIRSHNKCRLDSKYQGHFLPDQCIELARVLTCRLQVLGLNSRIRHKVLQQRFARAFRVASLGGLEIALTTV